MRIAIVHPYPVAHGGEAQGSRVIVRDRAVGSLLLERGHDVIGLRTTRSPEWSAPSVDGFMTWTYAPVDESRRHLAGAKVTSGDLLEHLLHWSPEVVMLKGAGTTLGAQIFEAHTGPVAFLIGGRYRDRDVIAAELALAETPAQERYLRRRMGRRRVLRMPKLASDLFHPPRSEAEKTVDAIVVSGFSRHKNHRALIPLLDEDISITFVGDGPLRAEFESLAQGRRARVTFAGLIDTDRVAHLMRQSRVLLHPSTSEGFPRAVVEAMACAIPSVCIKGVVGTPLQHGRNALIVRGGEFVESALALLESNDRVLALGREARTAYEQHFSLAAVADVVGMAVSELQRDLEVFGEAGLRRRATAIRKDRIITAPRTLVASLRTRRATRSDKA